jgi:hypothetical protein
MVYTIPAMRMIYHTAPRAVVTPSAKKPMIQITSRIRHHVDDVRVGGIGAVVVQPLVCPFATMGLPAKSETFVTVTETLSPALIVSPEIVTIRVVEL